MFPFRLQKSFGVQTSLRSPCKTNTYKYDIELVLVFYSFEYLSS